MMPELCKRKQRGSLRSAPSVMLARCPADSTADLLPCELCLHIRSLFDEEFEFEYRAGGTADVPGAEPKNYNDDNYNYIN